MQTIRHIDAIDEAAISTRVIVAHAEMNALPPSDFIWDSTARLMPQELVNASLCFSSRSADGDDHRVRATGADSLLPEPKELPCRFVKQSSPRSRQPSSWSEAFPQAARGIGVTIITTAIIMVITIMATTTIMVTGIGAGTIIMAITTTTAIITTTVTITTVTTTTNDDKPADGVGRLTTLA